MGFDPLGLEPAWREVDIGHTVDVLLEVIVIGSNGKHLCKSSLAKKFIVLQGNLPKCSFVAVLGAKVLHKEGGFRLLLEGAHVMHFGPADDSIFDHAVEGCSGIGCLGAGLESLGMTIKASADQSAFMCDFMLRNGRTGVVHGNIGDRSTIFRMWEACPQSALLAGGFSCQPWSMLGDQKKSDDGRASSLVFLLRCAYFLRSHTILLECVQSAGKDREVQAMIRSFCLQTGFRQAECNLQLSHLMPATRDRWWCVLVHPIVPQIQLAPLPKLEPAAVFGDLFPMLHPWPADDIDQLRLDRYESWKFQECGGLAKNLILSNEPLRTALHGWGNQLAACPCGCRTQGMSDSRLRERGLFGALLLVGGDYSWSTMTLPCTRHIHPVELAALHGLPLDVQWHPSLRGSLAALGQLASPVQSCWVISQVQCHFAELCGRPMFTPEQGLMKHFERFFCSLGEILPVMFQHPRVQAFSHRVHSLLREHHQFRLVPSSVAFDDREKSLNSQRRGRQDLLMIEDRQKQPAVGMQEPIQEEKQPATEPRELEKQKQPADETQALKEEAVSPKWTQSPVHAMPCPQTDGAGPSHTPIQLAAQPSSQFLANQVHGGIPAFATVRNATVPRSDSEPLQNSLPNHPFDKPQGSGFVQSTVVGSELAATQVDDDAKSDSPGSFTQDLALDMHMQDIEASRVPAALPEPFSDDEPMIAECAPADTFDPTLASVKDTHVVQIIHLHETVLKPVFVTVSKTSTIGNISVAECALTGLRDYDIRICNEVGVSLKLGDVTTPFQQLFIDRMSLASNPGQLPEGLRSAHECTRMQLLYCQGPWVAVDEMNHYLHLMCGSGLACFQPACVVPFHYMVEDMCQLLHSWAAQCVHKLSSNTRLLTALLVENHWFPVLVASTPFGIAFFTTPEGKPWLEVAVQQIPNVRDITQIWVSSSFPHDCGFQTVAWLTATAFQADLPDQHFGVTTFLPADACTWRGLFAHSLHAEGRSSWIVRPTDCRFGGTLTDVVSQLGQLLQSKGVPEEQLRARVDLVVERVGRSRVLQILRGSHPWRDLKAACNAQSPVIQLVHAGELQVAISNRLKDDTPFGNKKTKKQGQPRKPETRVPVSPCDISVPNGIFKEGSDTALSQLRASDIGSQSRGVVLLTSAEAAPYLKLPQAVSCNGLALLILDHANPLLSGVGTAVRFPAICKETSEPLLLTACMVQIGAVEVTRNLLAEAPKIDEVDNVVIKVVLFRDEFGEVEWGEFCKSPIKHIIKLTPGFETEGVILDCWDRQFLNIRMSKSKPADADVYSAAFRLTGLNFTEILQESGTHGLYYEPRTVDGRSHAVEYKVIWLNKQSKPDASLCKQQTKHWTCLVRSGNRFGLRVLASDAQAVHSQHKPNQMFLEGSQTMAFLVGPMPFGATRQSLNKAFKTWAWNAKPTQPRGRSADGRGILWEVMATAPPPYDVYQMQHSDILISAIPKKMERSDAAHNAVQGSAKTIAALRASNSSSHSVSAGDPWESRGQDPWASWQPNKQAKQASVPSVDHAEVLAASVEKRVMKTVQTQLSKLSPADTNMQDDAKVHALEDRIARLELTVGQNHQQQQQHNAEVATQLTQMQKTVDAQGASLQSHFDRKLEEQLSHIERLLSSKKPRTDWRCGRTLRSVGLTPFSSKPLHRTWYGWFLSLFLWTSLCRIGEASHPGPVIGTFNPTGVMGKSELINELPGPALWGISETHLSAQGIPKFKKELTFGAPGLKFVPGCPAPDLATSLHTVGGKSSGVGILSAWPCRALTNNWAASDWNTARIQVGATLINDVWFKMGVAYGYAGDTYTRSTMAKTDHVLHLLTERIVHQSHGPRAIVGDFNHGRGSLPQFDVWRAHGFVELQEYALQKWGRPIEATGRGVDAIDQVWISSELIPLLKSVHTDSTWFPGHSIVFGIFDDVGKPDPVFIWRKPLQLPWHEIEELPSQPELACSSDPELAFAEIFQCLEQRVDGALAHAGKPSLLPQHKGRCLTTAPSQSKFQVTPLKASRSGEIGVTFLGENFQHVKWCRQVRRLQSMLKLLRSSKPAACMTCHKHALWLSIRKATGFPKGFTYAWQHRSVRLPGAPDSLPLLPPDLHTCEIIFQSFFQEFQSLELALKRYRVTEAKQRRRSDRNVIFQDVSRPRSQPLQTLVHSTSVCITDVQAREASYEPPTLDVAEPVFGPQGLLALDAHEAGKLTLKHDAVLAIGDVICQESLVGRPHEVFLAFQKLWDLMWNKHLDRPVDSWNPVIQTIAEHVPKPTVPFSWSPITEEQWLHEVGRRKARSAPGPDGVTRDDLARMPPDLVTALVRQVNRIESEGQHWPQTCMTGLITNLEKHPKASQPTDYRPITVLSQVYRTWGSLRTRQILAWMDHFSPDNLAGNRPSMCTHHVWHKMSQVIEQAQVEGSRLGGVVADVVKAFNTLPRPIVMALALHVGLPKGFVAAWHDAVTRLQRRFLIAGSCSEAQFSVTGYPEGDGLSIIAMSLVNMFMHAWISAPLHHTEVLSYVDNWELLAFDPTELSRAYCRMEQFADLIDIQLDGRKTYGWALDSNDRTQLRCSGLDIKYDARDLGGHVIYCKKQTMGTLKNRIASNHDAWSWLARSSAPVDQKLRMLSTVMWPRLLHGISGLWIGAEHCKRLRSQAMQSLNWQKKGASSLIQFGLNADLRADPGFWVLLTTALDFRRYANNAPAFAVLTDLAVGNYPRYTNGPCGAFLHRLHEIGWYWEGNGFMLDHQLIRMHIVDTPVQFLVGRLKDAWGKLIGSLICGRDTFEGTQFVDLQLSHRTNSHFKPDEMGLLRAARNGTFFTRDAQVHAHLSPTKTCPFCPAQDGVRHRHLECPAFHDLRLRLTQDVRFAISQMPECVSVRGWMTESEHAVGFLRSLDMIPDMTGDFISVEPPHHELHLFTDGSCIESTIPALRLATWGVCLANLDDVSFHPVAQGGVPHGLQTVLRAEISACISAVKFGIRCKRVFTVWTDNQLVFDSVRKMLQSAYVCPGVTKPDHDLWKDLYREVGHAISLSLFSNIVKVRSHEDAVQYGCHVEKWAIQGNDAADELASAAWAHLPLAVRDSWTKYAADYKFRSKMIEQIHRLIVSIGLRVVAQKKELLQQAEQQWDAAVDAPRPSVGEPVSLGNIQPWESLPARHSLRVIAKGLNEWMLSLSSGEDVSVHWVSSAHLLVHYQMTTGDLGVRFDQSTNLWAYALDHIEEHGFCFQQSANWLQAALRCYCRALTIDYDCQIRMPDGCCFRCHTPCLRLAMSSAAFWKLDRSLRDRGVTAVKSPKKDFRNLRPFIPSRWWLRWTYVHCFTQCATSWLAENGKRDLNPKSLQFCKVCKT